MVSFQCEGCNDVVTKKKLDAHINKCYSDVTCIDCMTTFHDWSYRLHTSCISEAQKTQGALYKDKKKGTAQDTQQQTPRTPTADTEKTIAKVNVPPPAPSPPRIPNNVNALDYLVKDTSPNSAATSKTNAKKAKSAASAKQLQDLNEAQSVTYGSGPVPRSLDRLESNLDQMANSQFGSKLDEKHRTPHLTRIVEPPTGKHDKSEKKRKRVTVDDLELTAAKHDKTLNRRSLHTGLTGGLLKMLANAEDRDDEASPSSPKKRTKHSKQPKGGDSSDEDIQRRRKDNQKHSFSETNGDMRLVRTEPASRAIELHERGRQLARTGPRQKMEQGNSEFFLSLVDKGHKSSKGQSIWGVLKMFHEGQRDEQMSSQDELILFHQNAERALFRGLRMKINRDGEVVLFARADKEHSVSAD